MGVFDGNWPFVQRVWGILYRGDWMTARSLDCEILRLRSGQGLGDGRGLGGLVAGCVLLQAQDDKRGRGKRRCGSFDRLRMSGVIA